jgi:uncharacterized protein (TIGR03086 family)
MSNENDLLLDQLSRSLAAVGEVIQGLRPNDWNAPTPCTDWAVSRVVLHLAGMNMVFTALLDDRPPPGRETIPDDQLPSAYQESSAALVESFSRTGVLERTYSGPLGSATGAERLQIRMYDLLAHGWDLCKATGQPTHLPADAAETALTFVRAQLTDDARPGRFAPAQTISEQAPAIDRLAAFLGRSPDWTREISRE